MDKTAATETKTYPLKIRGLYRVVRGIIGFLLRVLSRVEVTGREHIPNKGPFLLVVNHLHWLDSPALMVVFPYRSHVFAGEKWEGHWFVGPLMHSLGAIFVRRGEVDRHALQEAQARLEGGGVLGLAPEGTRSKTGGLQQARHGAAYLALRTGARVVPVVMTGQEKLFPSLRHLRRARVRASYGPAFDPPPMPGGKRPTSAQVHEFTDEIMYRLAAMLPEEYRGVYKDVADKRPDLLQVYASKR